MLETSFSLPPMHFLEANAAISGLSGIPVLTPFPTFPHFRILLRTHPSIYQPRCSPSLATKCHCSPLLAIARHRSPSLAIARHRSPLLSFARHYLHFSHAPTIHCTFQSLRIIPYQFACSLTLTAYLACSLGIFVCSESSIVDLLARQTSLHAYPAHRLGC